MVAQAIINPYESIGFVIPSATVPKRVIANVQGFTKVGKSHFALSGRSPICLFNLDVGDEGVVEKFTAAGKELYVYNVPFVRPLSLVDSSEDANQTKWKEQWVNLNKKLEETYRLNPGTVIIDTATEVYELARLAHFAKTSQVQPHQYGFVNAEMNAMVNQAYAAERTSTVFINKMRVGFNTQQPEFHGFSQMPFGVQVNLENTKSANPSGAGIDTFYSRIIDCRQQPNAVGRVLTGESFSLEYLEKLIHDYDFNIGQWRM